MKLFISYARVDKLVCKLVVERLNNVHEVWYDERLYAGQVWWEEILRQLDWCEGFVYLLSPESIKSEYCQKEFAIAKSKQKELFPVVIRTAKGGRITIPDDLKHIHYANLSEDLEEIQKLLDALAAAEHNPDQVSAPKAPTAVVDTTKPGKDTAPLQAVREAAMAMETKNFDQAVFTLKQVQQQKLSDRDTRIITRMLEEAEKELEQQVNLLKAERGYAPIVELVTRKSTRRIGCQEFDEFRKEFPDYDPKDLAKICSDEAVGRSTKRRAKNSGNNAAGTERQASTVNIAAPDLSKILPAPFEWCWIPAGKVTLTEPGYEDYLQPPQTFRVKSFWMAMYPVTINQFDVFLQAKDGYDVIKWWNYSEAARKWRDRQNRWGNGLRYARFWYDDRPETRVSWYDAVAFCRWLTSKALTPAERGAPGRWKLRLPTEQEWQRAAQGNEAQIYPWGDWFDKTLANTEESGIRTVTPVTHYKYGASPFGVMGMSGNVREFCLTAWETGSNKMDGGDARVVRGGSWSDSRYHVCTTTRASVYRGTADQFHGFRIVYASQPS